MVSLVRVQLKLYIDQCHESWDLLTKVSGSKDYKYTVSILHQPPHHSFFNT